MMKAKKPNINKTRTAAVRSLLRKKLNLPTSEVVSILKQKGVDVNERFVYRVRHAIKAKIAKKIDVSHKTISANGMFLNDFVINVLKQNPSGMTDRDLATAIQKAGYVSHSRNFINVLRQKLYNMCDSKTIHRARKKGDKFHYCYVESQNPIQSFLAKSDDYRILREAIIDLATAQGHENPEMFPDYLIKERKNYLSAKDNYNNLFKK